MSSHFLLDRHRWTMAALHHFEAWEREEREIFTRMVQRRHRPAKESLWLGPITGWRVIFQRIVDRP